VSARDLFDTDPLRPLADRMRPRTIAEFVGQPHLLGPGKPLAASIAAGRLHSLILWGPPGTGKTTLARLIAQASDAQFIQLSAVMAGVKEMTTQQRMQRLISIRFFPTGDRAAENDNWSCILTGI